jgi:hypothetical protein
MRDVLEISLSWDDGLRTASSLERRVQRQGHSRTTLLPGTVSSLVRLPGVTQWCLLPLPWTVSADLAAAGQHRTTNARVSRFSFADSAVLVRPVPISFSSCVDTATTGSNKLFYRFAIRVKRFLIIEITTLYLS